MSITWKATAGDLTLDGTGRFTECQGIEKCAQDILESLLNNYDPDDPSWFNGSELYKVEGMVSSLSGMGVDTLIEHYARSAVQRLMEQQEADAAVDDDELIADIALLQAQSLGNLTWAFFLKCITESEDPATVGFDIEAANPLPGNLQLVRPGSFAPGGQTFK